ncbi:unnamed protein product [Peronospora farinosa]|uniref:Uncharacterized protein n=1 Tax=Peronospora farinosa TaxID=134698 RepID=A0ABN8C1Q1_9STRA|nr:unnamed protein product [Peronospora farinosa]
MAEVSRPWKPAVKLEPEETLASYVFNYSVVLTPTHVQKKRRVHSTNNMPGTMHIGRNQDKNMTLSRVPSGNTMQWIHKSNEKQDQDQFRTARQRFVLEDEEIEATTPLASSCALKFKPVQPKLSTSKSEGRANVLPSRRRRQFQQDQVSQSTKRSVNRAPVQDQGLGRDDSAVGLLRQYRLVDQVKLQEL